MEKKSIFKKIDTIYTNVVKVIIGDTPIQDLTPNDENILSKENIKNPQKIYTSLKDKFLNLGKPENEKVLLYEEVIKRDRQDKKEKKLTDKESKKNIKKTSTKSPSKSNTSTTTASTKKVVVSKKTKSTKKKIKNIKERTKKETLTKSTNVKKAPSSSKTDTKKTTISKKTKETTKTSPSATKTTAKKNTTKNSPKKITTKKKVDHKTTVISDSKKSTTKTTAKKSTIKTPITKNPTVNTIKKKSKAAPRGAKKAAKIALYIKDIKKHYGEVDEPFVTIIVNNLGPSIYKKDAETVACSDPKELDAVRKNFLIKKLGIKASNGVLDAAIQDVCTELKGVRTKYRATFYYALAKKFKKESMLS